MTDRGGADSRVPQVGLVGVPARGRPERRNGYRTMALATDPSASHGSCGPSHASRNRRLGIRPVVRTDRWDRLSKVAIQQRVLADRSAVIARIACPRDNERCPRIHTAQGIRRGPVEGPVRSGVRGDLAVGFEVSLTRLQTSRNPDLVLEIADPGGGTLGCARDRDQQCGYGEEDANRHGSDPVTRR